MKFLRSKRSGLSTKVREFVYLDEVSVESLLASVDGEILVQSTQTRSSSWEASGSGSLGGSGLFQKAAYSSALKASAGKEVQELRKSVAQSAFARFRSRNYDQFVIQQADFTGSKRNKRDTRLLAERNPKALRRLRQGIPLDELARGDLLEIETDLAAADIYKARTALHAVTDVVEAYPSFLEIEYREAFNAARPLIELMDRLNGNTIPVVGASPSLRIETVSGAPWLVQVPPDVSSPSMARLVLESDVQPEWFWGDPGRSLFQSDRFKVLCRIVRPVPSKVPASSYVGTILRTIDDRLASTVDGMGSMFLGALRSGHQSSAARRPEELASAVVDWYAANAGSLAGRPDDSDERLKTLCEAMINDIPSEDLKRFLLEVESALGLQTTMGSDDRAALRDSVRSHFELWPWSTPPTAGSGPVPSEPGAQYIQIEVVAAYW